jgi:hypothetical protein
LESLPTQGRGGGGVRAKIWRHRVADKRIGILIGDEWSWPPAFLNEVNRRQAGVTAEMVKLAGTRLSQPSPYHVIIDRISYEIPYYRTFLRSAVLAGTRVINNPFWNGINDSFFNANLVAHMGFAHPRTVALPSHSYVEGILEQALRNLTYPIPWADHINYLGGFPVLLQPIYHGAWRRVYVLESYEDLWRAYNKTGAEPMMLREHVAWDKYIRCICIGPEYIMPIPYSPGPQNPNRYHQDDHYLTPEEKRRVIESAITINQALGYEINAIDFAFCDGTIYAIEVTNPVPDFDVKTITPYFFDWAVKRMADYAIHLALSHRPDTGKFEGGQHAPNVTLPAASIHSTVPAPPTLPNTGGKTQNGHYSSHPPDTNMPDQRREH